MGERAEYISQANRNGGKIRVRGGADSVRKALTSQSIDSVTTTAPKKWAIPISKWSEEYPNHPPPPVEEQGYAWIDGVRQLCCFILKDGERGNHYEVSVSHTASVNDTIDLSKVRPEDSQSLHDTHAEKAKMAQNKIRAIHDKVKPFTAEELLQKALSSTGMKIEGADDDSDAQDSDSDADDDEDDPDPFLEALDVFSAAPIAASSKAAAAPRAPPRAPVAKVKVEASISTPQKSRISSLSHPSPSPSTRSCAEATPATPSPPAPSPGTAAEPASEQKGRGRPARTVVDVSSQQLSNMKIVERDLDGFVETFKQELELDDEPDGHTKDQSRAFTKRVKARAARLEEHIGKIMKLDRQWKKFDDRLCTDELNELKRKYDTLLDDFKKLHCIVQCMYSDKDEQDVIISAFHALRLSGISYSNAYAEKYLRVQADYNLRYTKFEELAKVFVEDTLKEVLGMELEDRESVSSLHRLAAGIVEDELTQMLERITKKDVKQRTQKFLHVKEFLSVLGRASCERKGFLGAQLLSDQIQIGVDLLEAATVPIDKLKRALKMVLPSMFEDEEDQEDAKVQYPPLVRILKET